MKERKCTIIETKLFLYHFPGVLACLILLFRDSVMGENDILQAQR